MYRFLGFKNTTGPLFGLWYNHPTRAGENNIPFRVTY